MLSLWSRGVYVAISCDQGRKRVREQNSLWPQFSKDNTQFVTPGILTQNVSHTTLLERGVPLVSSETFSSKEHVEHGTTSCNLQRNWNVSKIKLRVFSSNPFLALSSVNGSTILLAGCALTILFPTPHSQSAGSSAPLQLGYPFLSLPGPLCQAKPPPSSLSRMTARAT